MLSQYTVEYSFWQGSRHVQEVVMIVASSESYAIQKVTDELIRRLGTSISPAVYVLQPTMS